MKHVYSVGEHFLTLTRVLVRGFKKSQTTTVHYNLSPKNGAGMFTNIQN
jgi:hypothetical protein